MSPRGPGAPPRALRLLLRLYPAAFLQRHRDDLLEALEDAWREEAQSAGRLHRARFWLRLVGDALRTRANEAGRRHPKRPRRRSSYLAGFAEDSRYAFRALAKQPGFAVLVVAILALGIGANAAVFNALHDVVLRPLPYPGSERLVRVFEYFGAEPYREYVTAPSFLGWRESSRSFETLAALYTYRDTGADYTEGDRPERIRTLRVSAGYLLTYGVAPYLGREFSAEEERGDSRVALVSHGFWRTRLGRDPDVLGRRLVLDGEPHTVVGVTPEGFSDALVGDVDVWLNLDLERHRESTGNWYLSVIGRLAAGTALDDARDDTERVQLALAEAQAGLRDHHPNLVPLEADVVGTSRDALGLLMGAVGVVLIVACVNVAQLMSVRGLDRRREMAVRAALGCGRLRLVRQLLLEGFFLAAAGAVAGLCLARLGSALWLELAASSLPRSVDAEIDWVLAVFAAAVAAATALSFGLAPALRGSRVDLARALREGGRAHTGGAGLSAARRWLVATQLASTFLLTSGAAVLTKSFVRLAGVDPRVETEGIVAFEANLPDARYPEPEQRAAFHRQLASALDALPGVRAAGSVSWLPGQGHYHEWGFFLPRLGDGTPEGSPGGVADQRVVEGRYFEALRIPLVRGRSFEAWDGAASPPVVVVNEELVRRFIPETVEPIGTMLRVSGTEREIVGVVADTAVDTRGTRTPIVYHSHAQMADDRNWPLVQVVAADGAVPRASLAGVLERLDPNLVLHEPRELAPLYAAEISREKLLAFLLLAFSGLAFVLAGLGLYGVLSHSVGQRRRELGVRMALGADAASMRTLVMRQAGAVGVLGVLAGLAASLLAARGLDALVFETSPQDPASLALAAGLLIGLTVLAAYLPARRATQVAPAEVLRAE